MEPFLIFWFIIFATAEKGYVVPWVWETQALIAYNTNLWHMWHVEVRDNENLKCVTPKNYHMASSHWKLSVVYLSFIWLPRCEGEPIGVVFFSPFLAPLKSHYSPLHIGLSVDKGRLHRSFSKSMARGFRKRGLTNDSDIFSVYPKQRWLRGKLNGWKSSGTTISHGS